MALNVAVDEACIANTIALTVDFNKCVYKEDLRGVIVNGEKPDLSIITGQEYFEAAKEINRITRERIQELMTVVDTLVPDRDVPQTKEMALEVQKFLDQAKQFKKLVTGTEKWPCRIYSHGMYAS